MSSHDPVTLSMLAQWGSYPIIGTLVTWYFKKQKAYADSIMAARAEAEDANKEIAKVRLEMMNNMLGVSKNHPTKDDMNRILDEMKRDSEIRHKSLSDAIKGVHSRLDKAFDK